MLWHPNLTRTQVIGRECCDTQISQEVFFIHIKCEIWAATTVLSVFHWMLKREICRNHQKYYAHSDNWWRGAEILKYIKQELVHFLCEPPYGPRDLEIVSDASARVLWKLKKWKMSEDEEDYLEAFNELVRGNLVSIFVETLQGSFLPFGSLVFGLLSPKLKLCKLKASLGHLETIDWTSHLPWWMGGCYQRHSLFVQTKPVWFPTVGHSQQRFLSSDGHLL